MCGGCRARAYGMTGDVMAEDPLCTHTPGRFAGSPLLASRGPASAPGAPGAAALEYGHDAPATIAWDDAAAGTDERDPPRSSGAWWSRPSRSRAASGLDRVTVEELEAIRSRMPTPKMFG